MSSGQSPKFTYVVSACLAGIRCRYDGDSNPREPVARLVKQGLALPICPERLSHLPTPRPPSEQKNGRIVSQDGTDITEAFELGAERALSIALEHRCTIGILKARSPSCGINGVYDGSFSRHIVPGEGLWAQKLRKAGLSLFSEEQLPPEVENPPV